MKTYPMTHEGLTQAINGRHNNLKTRNKVLILLGVIISIGVLNLPGASIVAFKCI